MEINVPVKASTATGTVFSILFNLPSADIAKTVVLAAIGAVVSFSVSMLLSLIVKRRRKR